MARLPQPGSDTGQWGEILNDYLSQSLDTGGALKSGSVGSSQLASGAVTAAAIADGTITTAKLQDQRRYPKCKNIVRPERSHRHTFTSYRLLATEYHQHAV
jgi:hypothetical protein